MKKKALHEGHIDLQAEIASIVSPELAHHIWAELTRRFPELENKSECANCGASMEEYRYSFRWHHAMLLIVMAREVRERMTQGMPFTQANAVHVPSLNTTHAVKCSTTQARLLGLVAKSKNARGQHVAGTWVITDRGWAALRGEEVPEHVIAFRNAIVDRPGAVTTLAKALGTLGSRSQVDEREKGYQSEYSPSEWVTYAGTAEGRLF